MKLFRKRFTRITECIGSFGLKGEKSNGMCITAVVREILEVGKGFFLVLWNKRCRLKQRKKKKSVTQELRKLSEFLNKSNL